MYSDARPKYLHIANLQKGLIFVYRNMELVGEGTGFGVPIVLYQDRTYYPGSSTLRIWQENDCLMVAKQFVLDMISEIRFGDIKTENKIIRKLIRVSDELYMKHKHLRLLILVNLSKKFGAHRSFVKVKPRGSIDVTYRIHPPRIRVEADFTSLERRDLQKIFLLNEQSSRYFRKYEDSDGTVLFDKQIGEWEIVESEWACLSDKGGAVCFRLWKVEDAVLHRGREFLENTLDWVGLDYEVSPNKTCFEYDIEIFGSCARK